MIAMEEILMMAKLVVRKMMLAPKKGDTTQRHQLFRTRCTINGNICDLIIDSGSQENIIGKSIVEKLQLSIEKHPSPYSIGWIKTVGNIQVTERCEVPFLSENTKTKCTVM